jgi:hypothetical protein
MTFTVVEATVTLILAALGADNVETARHRGQQATRAGLRAVVVNLGRWPGPTNDRTADGCPR